MQDAARVPQWSPARIKDLRSLRLTVRGGGVGLGVWGGGGGVKTLTFDFKRVRSVQMFFSGWGS